MGKGKSKRKQKGGGSSSSKPAGKPRVTRAAKERVGDLLGLTLVWVITAAMLLPTAPIVARDVHMLGAMKTIRAEPLAKEDWDPHGSGTFKVSYRIVVDGKTYTGKDITKPPWRPDVPLEVEYLERDPSKNRPAGTGGWVEMLFFVLGVVFLFCSCWLSVKAVRGEKL